MGTCGFHVMNFLSCFMISDFAILVEDATVTVNI